ncbi:MAG: hypothetical protein U9Q30_01165 [Campylobacterota bacterium]|nr:hypothetical protein [Campylobacterota bacterium]
MNILIADTDKQIINLLETFKSIQPDINIFEVTNCIDGLEQYKNNNIDLVIIDFDIKNYVNLLNEIIKIDKFQKTITISEVLCYSENLGCDFCTKNHHRIRLLKPFEAKELFDIVLHFNDNKCKYFKSLDHIEDFMNDIIKRYSNYIYDNISKQIKVRDDKLSSSSSIKDLVDIVNILNEHNVKYNMEDENTIQLF